MFFYLVFFLGSCGKRFTCTHTTKPTSEGNRLFRTLLPRVRVVPDLIGDLLLVLLLLAGTAAAKDDEGEENEKQQNTDYCSCDDAGCVRGCKRKREIFIEMHRFRV